MNTLIILPKEFYCDPFNRTPNTPQAILYRRVALQQEAVRYARLEDTPDAKFIDRVLEARNMWMNNLAEEEAV
ncbi:MAG: hypothetical protein QNJ44_20115 [Rhodobacter sp.]|nr:hypothetical protein [Rhodobacter sp.]